MDVSGHLWRLEVELGVKRRFDKSARPELPQNRAKLEGTEMTLDELERLSKAATPAPWKLDPSDDDWNVNPRNKDIVSGDEAVVCRESGCYPPTEGDAAFIIAARNHIDALLEIARAAQRLGCGNAFGCDMEGREELDAALAKLEGNK